MANRRGWMERLARSAADWAGSSMAFALSLTLILVWAATGPLFKFSDTWQLVINTGTTIVTFLMVFLIQRSQNKDSLALHLKLNELVASARHASNRLIAVEDLGEDEVHALHEHFATLAELARKRKGLRESHSVEEAIRRDDAKHDKRPSIPEDGLFRV